MFAYKIITRVISVGRPITINTTMENIHYIYCDWTLIGINPGKDFLCKRTLKALYTPNMFSKTVLLRLSISLIVREINYNSLKNT